MSRRLKLLYPFMFAVLPILHILTRSPGGASLSDGGAVLTVALLGCAVLYAVVGLAVGRRRRAGSAVPLIVLALILWFYGSDGLATRAHRFGPGVVPAVLLTAALITVVVIWWLVRRPAYLDRLATFLTLTGLLLLVSSGVIFARNQLRSRSALRNSGLIRELAQPVLKRSPRSAGAAQRDIYLIVLDEYANGAVLREQFGFDNHVFEDSLRQLGFTIPRSVRTNYVHTLLSLPSILNFSHMTRLTRELGPLATDPTVPNYLLEHNRTVAFLKSLGYTFLFFPSQWWVSTEHNREADWEFQPWTGFSLGRDATRSDLRRSLVRSTALDLLRRDHAHDADHVRRTLAALTQVPGVAGPTFVFAHIINPHRPYVFDADCRTARTGAGGSDAAGRRRGYVDQVQCLNRQLLGVVRTLLKRSSPPPIILLQGDHGTNVLEYSKARTAGEVSPGQASERFGAFGAYYLPQGGSSRFAGSTTTVNLLRDVLDYYLDAAVPRAPDALYMSLERTPYDLTEVDPASLTPRSGTRSALAPRLSCDSASGLASWSCASPSRHACSRISRRG